MSTSLRHDVVSVVPGRWDERDGILWSPRLSERGLVAGFTTRSLGSMGGRVTPPDESRQNRERLAVRLGFHQVVRVKQVHGDVVVRADGPFQTWPEADAMWTDRPGVLLGVVAADCVPVLVADEEGRIGAAHAGWEGTTRHVAMRLVDAMREGGAEPHRMVAALGPSIGPCCYQIGPERVRIIRERLESSLLSWVFRESRGKTYFDLWNVNAEQLGRAGVRLIEQSRVCTKCGVAGAGRRLPLLRPRVDIFSHRGRPRGTDAIGMGLGFIGRRA